MKQLVLAAALAICATGPAAAYTSYILPADFSPDGEVRLEAAFASTFFTPAVGLPADMTLLYPDGTQFTFDRVESTGQVTTARANVAAHGTYRVSTGERMGAISTMVADNGAWRQLAQGETPPAGIETRTLQTVTVADTYVSVGAPSRTVVDRHIGALALHPVTHPNQILTGQGFLVELLFNGAPFPNMPVVLYENGDIDTDVGTYFVTDASGRATVTFSTPGRYVIAARHRGEAPAGSEAQVRSYTTTLTFEVIDALPAYPPPPPAPERQRRRF
jgi:uncharacterized GH25 family protein